MSMIAPLVMAAVSIAAAAAQAAAQSAQAEAADAANNMQTQNNNFRSRWAKEDDNNNRMIAFQNRLEQNYQIERSAAVEKAASQIAVSTMFDNQRSQSSKDSMIANEAFLSSATARGSSLRSGSVRAVLRQNMSVMGKNMLALRNNERAAVEQTETVYLNRLANRNYSGPSAVSFIPAASVHTDNSSSIWASNMLMGAVSAAGIIGGDAAGGAFDKTTTPRNPGTMSSNPYRGWGALQ